MSNKNIKVGDTYLLPITVTEIRISGFLHAITPCNKRYQIDPVDIAKLLQEDIKNIETTPKYDPCREFREGDKVRMVMRDGRHPYCQRMREHIVPSDTICTVIRCELNGFVALEYNNDYKPVVHFSFLELVTPVEAEPYFISEGAGIIELYNRTPDELVKTWFYDTVKAGVEALAEAEAECARLNEEYKKDHACD